MDAPGAWNLADSVATRPGAARSKECKRMKNLLMTITTLAALMLLLTLGGCEEKSPIEKAGDKVEDAADEVGDAVEDAADEVEDAVDDKK